MITASPTLMASSVPTWSGIHVQNPVCPIPSSTRAPSRIHQLAPSVMSAATAFRDRAIRFGISLYSRFHLRAYKARVSRRILQRVQPSKPAVCQVRAAELDQHNDVRHAGIWISDRGPRSAPDSVCVETIVLAHGHGADQFSLMTFVSFVV